MKGTIIAAYLVVQLGAFWLFGFKAWLITLLGCLACLVLILVYDYFVHMRGKPKDQDDPD